MGGREEEVPSIRQGVCMCDCGHHSDAPAPQPLCCFPVAAVHSAPWGRLHVGGWRTCSENLVSFHFMLIVSVIDKGLKSADSFFVFNLNGLVVLLHTGSSVYFAVPLYVFYF